MEGTVLNVDSFDQADLDIATLQVDRQLAVADVACCIDDIVDSQYGEQPFEIGNDVADVHGGLVQVFLVCSRHELL